MEYCLEKDVYICVIYCNFCFLADYCLRKINNTNIINTACFLLFNFDLCTFHGQVMLTSFKSIDYAVAYS